MALITNLPAASGLSNTDLLVIDTGSQTQKTTVGALLEDTICGDGTEFASGDLDTLTTPGHYRIPTYSAVTNAPAVSGAASAELFVIRRGSTIRAFQLIIVCTSSTSCIAVRGMSSATSWQNWTIYTAKDDSNSETIATFTGTAQTTVTLSHSLSDYRLILLRVLDTDGYIIAAATIPVTYIKNNTHKLYGGSSTVWGSFTFTSSETQVSMNRTSSTTRSCIIVGIK